MRKPVSSVSESTSWSCVTKSVMAEISRDGLPLDTAGRSNDVTVLGERADTETGTALTLDGIGFTRRQGNDKVASLVQMPRAPQETQQGRSYRLARSGIGAPHQPGLVCLPDRVSRLATGEESCPATTRSRRRGRTISARHVAPRVLRCGRRRCLAQRRMRSLRSLRSGRPLADL